MPIRVLLADDHAVVRDGIKAIVERAAEDIQIIGEASNGQEAVQLAKTREVDVYVIDISMPVLNGMETCKQIRKIDPQGKIIILSMHDNRSFLEKALECGVKGYVLKESATEEVIQAICEVSRNRVFVSPKMKRYLVEREPGYDISELPSNKVVNLTKKEREVLQLVAEGFSNKEIAKQQGRSLNTVLVHRKNIMRKLGIHKQADLIRYALKEGLCSL